MPFNGTENTQMSTESIAVIGHEDIQLRTGKDHLNGKKVTLIRPVVGYKHGEMLTGIKKENKTVEG
jgi:hypothetical protein